MVTPWEHGMRIDEQTPENCEYFYEIGVKALQNRKVALCLMAGGQGTRLGCKGPKGLFTPNLPTPQSLFQIQANRIIHFCKHHNTPLPKWLIMTSDATHADTITAFYKNHYYGYDQTKLFFFKQNNLPSLSINEKPLFLNHSFVQNPDGSGGIIPALHDSGLASELFHTFTETLIVYNVDNLLVQLPDPTFIGFHLSNQLDVTAKAIVKSTPDEKVGVFAKKHGNIPSILEYTDTPPHQIAQFTMGNAGIYAFSTSFIMQLREKTVPHHRSWKKIPHDGDMTPVEPNGWKEELFIFDWFVYTSRFMWWEIRREDEFAPLKNADPYPIDSPNTATQLWNQKWLRKLQSFNITLPSSTQFDIAPDVEYWDDIEWKQWIETHQTELTTLSTNIVIIKK